MAKKHYFLIFSVLFFVLIPLVFGATQQLSVQTCTYTGCTTVGWNDLDNTADGSTLPPGSSDDLTFSDPSFDVKSTINSITVMHSHSGAGGIRDNITYTFQNTAKTTTYCTSSIANQQTYRYEIVTPAGCSWTYQRLTDLLITVTNNAGASKNEYNDYMNFSIDYTPYNDSQGPNITLGDPQNDTWKTYSNITFYFTPVDENIIPNCSLIINSTKNETKTPITNGTQNNISSVISDGYWLWTINCTDSWNNTATNSSPKLLKVDTKPPLVNLESPANNTPWTASPDVIFYFNSTDAMTTLSSCELIVDGGIKDTKINPAESTSLSFTFAPGNGQHNWSVNCTDANGLENSSYTHNVSVNYAGRTVAADKGTYVQGENATITGNNWNDGTVTLALTLANGTIEAWNTTAISGQISTWRFINYSYPVGQYNLTAYEYAAPSNNASTTFIVNKRTVNIYTDKENYYQGDKVRINGTGFSLGGTVTINITWSGGQNLTNTTSSQAGYIDYNYSINYTAALGNYNITAYDYYFKNLNATENFTVLQRIADVYTDSSSYGANQNVYITGLFFSILGNSNLTIFQNSTGKAAPFFPMSIPTNATGGFNYTWNTAETCPGVYGVRGVDLLYPFLNDTYYINLTAAGLSRNYSYAPNTCGAGEGPCLISNIQLADDIQNQTLTTDAAPNPNWIEINFTGSIPADAGITFARFYIKHYVGVGGSSFSRLDWYNSTLGAYQTVPGCAITSPVTNTLEYCDLTSQIKNGSAANSVSIRVYYTRNGGSSNAYIDYARMNYTANGSGACQDWASLPPSITSIIVDDDFSGVPNQIDLLGGMTKNVECNITVYDFDGYSTIAGANATFYYSQNKSGDPNDNNVHYSNIACTDAGNDGLENKYFRCSFDVYYYANNGTWYCNATAYDNSANIATNIDSTTINSLAAINVTPIIDFGNIEKGKESSSDVLANVTNIGNVMIDIGIDGYAKTDGDAIAMNCSDSNNISFDDERYSIISGQAWSSMTPITDTMAGVAGFDLQKQVNATYSEKNTYWKIRAPPHVLGNCDGVIVFTAIVG